MFRNDTAIVSTLARREFAAEMRGIEPNTMFSTEDPISDKHIIAVVMVTKRSTQMQLKPNANRVPTANLFIVVTIFVREAQTTVLRRWMLPLGHTNVRAAGSANLWSASS